MHYRPKENEPQPHTPPNPKHQRLAPLNKSTQQLKRNQTNQVPAVFLAALGGYVLAAFQTQLASKGGAEEWMCVFVCSVSSCRGHVVV